MLDLLPYGLYKAFCAASRAVWENPLGIVGMMCCACGGWEIVVTPEHIREFIRSHRSCGGDIEVVSE